MANERFGVAIGTGLAIGIMMFFFGLFQGLFEPAGTLTFLNIIVVSSITGVLVFCSLVVGEAMRTIGETIGDSLEWFYGDSD